MHRSIVGLGLLLMITVTSCGEQSGADEVRVGDSYKGQPVTVSTLEEGSEGRRWVTIEDYWSTEPAQRDQLLRDVWTQFAEAHGSALAEDVSDPRNLERSQVNACRAGPTGGDYVFWYRENNAGTPQVYAERCPGDL